MLRVGLTRNQFVDIVLSMHPVLAQLRSALCQRRDRLYARSPFLPGGWPAVGVTGPEHSAAVRMWQGRAVWHAAALPALAIGLGCKPSNPLLWGTHVLQQADLYAHLDL